MGIQISVLSPKCPDMHRPRYTPVAPPVDAQGEYNIPSEDNENGGQGGMPFAPAPPAEGVPYQAPLPRPPPKYQGKGRNPAPPVPPEPTPPGPTPSELESDNFYLPRTPPPRLPRADLDSSHGFFNPNPGLSNDPLYDSKTISYTPDGSPSNIQYNYTRHGRHLSWDWHNSTSKHYHGTTTGTDPAPHPEGWWRLEGHPDLDNSIFEEFLQQGQRSHQTSPTPVGQGNPLLGG